MVELARLSPGDISIRMYPDHPPPHFHAAKDDMEMVVDIRDLSIIDGQLPRKLERTVLRFARDHHQQLIEAWDALSDGSNPGRLDR